MNLQENIKRIQTIMGVIKEDNEYDDFEDLTNARVLAKRYKKPVPKNDIDFDDVNDESVNDDKWKLSYDVEDNEPNWDSEYEMEDLNNRIKNIIKDANGKNIKIIDLGKDKIEIKKPDGTKYMSPVNIFNVNVEIDKSKDEYISFDLRTVVFSKKELDNINQRYLSIKPMNLMYEKNGKSFPIPKNKSLGNYFFYDDISQYGNLRNRVIKMMMGYLDYN